MAGLVTIPDKYKSLVESAAARYGLPSNILALILQGESGWNPNAVGDGGNSFGLAQIYLPAHPSVRREDAIRPEFAINWTAQRLGAAFKRFNGNETATILYHNSPVVGDYYARTGKFGPTAKLAKHAQWYLSLILKPVGGLQGITRMATQTTAGSSIQTPEQRLQLPATDPAFNFIQALERAVTTQESEEQPDPLEELRAETEMAERSSKLETARRTQKGVE